MADIHVVEDGETLCQIAARHHLRSLKHLHDANREIIGANPDILKPGTKLVIPKWDAKSGDDLILARNASVGRYTGGATYAYPWVVYSATLCTPDGSVKLEEQPDGTTATRFASPKHYEVHCDKTGATLAEGEIGDSEELEVLVPDVRQKSLTVSNTAYELWRGRRRGYFGVSSRVVPARSRPRINVDTIIDCHSHIQSGATAPLPLVWHQSLFAEALKPSRNAANALSLALFIRGQGGATQQKPTEVLGDLLRSQLDATYGPESPLRSMDACKETKEFFTPTIIMPMDMDYAHIAGYPPSSSRIYHEGAFDKVIEPEPQPVSVISPEIATEKPEPEIVRVEDGVYYYERKHGLAAEESGTVVDVSTERPEHVWQYQSYKRQHDSTVAAVRKNPWGLIPMFHYDPRRWRNAPGGFLDETDWAEGPWDYPFDFVASKANQGIFIGFKMYPPLGYKPLDPRLPRLDQFYARCAQDGIPILAHCSPGGMTTHDAEHYHELDRVNLADEAPFPIGTAPRLSYKPNTPKGYFFNHYVHPRNWRPVLKKYRDLKLCLAHYGGDEWEHVGIESDWIQEITDLTREYPNVYTDVACLDFNEPATARNFANLLGHIRDDGPSGRYYHLRDKLLFGVDWYLTLLTPGRTVYKNFVESFHSLVCSVDEYQWVRSVLLNPVRFYGFDDFERIGSMRNALSEICDVGKKTEQFPLQRGFEKVTEIRAKAENIRDELEKASV